MPTSAFIESTSIQVRILVSLKAGYLGAFKRLVKGDAVVDGRRLRFLNDVEILNEDELLFTDSTSKWERRHFMHPILEQIPNGRFVLLQFS